MKFQFLEYIDADKLIAYYNIGTVQEIQFYKSFLNETDIQIGAFNLKDKNPQPNRLTSQGVL